MEPDVDYGYFESLDAEDYECWMRDILSVGTELYFHDEPTEQGPRRADDKVFSDIRCPGCNSRRVKRKNRATGHEFWGCTSYPACRRSEDFQEGPQDGKKVIPDGPSPWAGVFPNNNFGMPRTIFSDALEAEYEAYSADMGDR